MKKLVLTLVVIGLISALVLSFVYQWTEPKITAYEEEKRKEAVINVLTVSDDYREVTKDGLVFFEGNHDEEVAYEISGSGFQGEIRLMVGMRVDEEIITGIEILSHSETPGLGANIEKESFRDNFKDMPFGEYEVVKRKAQTQYEIEAITGATISSENVASIIEKAVQDINKAYGGGAE